MSKEAPTADEIGDRMKSMLAVTELCLHDMEVVAAVGKLKEAMLQKEAFCWCLGLDDQRLGFEGKASELAWGFALHRYDAALRDWIFAMDRSLAKAMERAKAKAQQAAGDPT